MKNVNRLRSFKEDAYASFLFCVIMNGISPSMKLSEEEIQRRIRIIREAPYYWADTDVADKIGVHHTTLIYFKKKYFNKESTENHIHTDDSIVY